MAVDRKFKNPDGKYETDFINCTVWNVVAEKLCEYCKKGDMDAVKARVQNNNYTDKNDNKVYSYEFIAEQVFFLQQSKKNKDKEEITEARSDE